MTRRSGGFTLLEVLVALVVLGLILVGIGGGVRFGIQAQRMQSRAIEAHSDLGATDRLLRGLVAQMDPGTSAEPPKITGGAAAVSFVTRLPPAAATTGSGGDAEVGLGVDTAHRLVLRWTPAIHAIRVGPPPPTATTVLLDGVQRVEWSFWGHAPGGSGAWQSTWTENNLPPLVRIRLVFPPSSGRSWPDIIAQTQRLPPGG